jgi:hypothetical protein
MVKAYAEQQRKLQKGTPLQNIFFDINIDAQMAAEIKESDLIIN